MSVTKKLAARVQSSGCVYHVRDEKTLPQMCARAGVHIMCVVIKQNVARVRSSGCAYQHRREARGALRGRRLTMNSNLRTKGLQKAVDKKKGYKHRGRFRRRHQKRAQLFTADLTQILRHVCNPDFRLAFVFCHLVVAANLSWHMSLNTGRSLDLNLPAGQFRRKLRQLF